MSSHSSCVSSSCWSCASCFLLAIFKQLQRNLQYQVIFLLTSRGGQQHVQIVSRFGVQSLCETNMKTLIHCLVKVLLQSKNISRKWLIFVILYTISYRIINKSLTFHVPFRCRLFGLVTATSCQF